MPSTMIKLDKIGEINIVRCFTIVEGGLLFPVGDCGSCNHCILAWRHFHTVVSGEAPYVEDRHLVELRRQIPEFGELEMPEFRRLNDQRGGGLAEKVLQNAAWGPLEGSVGYKTVDV